MKLLPRTYAQSCRRAWNTDVVPEGEALPVEIDKGDCMSGGGPLLLLLSFMCFAVAVMVLVKEPRGKDWIAAVGCSLFATALFGVFGMFGLRSRDKWTLTATSVERRWRGLGGWKQWSEPLSSYAGVLMYDAHRSGGGHGRAYTDYILDLHHPSDKRKTLRLWCSNSRDKHRTEWERYARLLNMPALMKTAHGIESRAVDDANKSVRERVKGVTFHPSAPPGRRLIVSVEDDGLLITARRGNPRKAAKAVLIVLGVMASIFIAGGLFLSGPEGMFFAAVGVFFLLSAAGLSFGSRVVGQYIKLSAAGVQTWWAHPLGRCAQKAFPSTEIEEIAVRKPQSNWSFKAVVIVTDSDTGWWGWSLEDEELEWVRDCIVAVISA